MGQTHAHTLPGADQVIVFVYFRLFRKNGKLYTGGGNQLVARNANEIQQHEPIIDVGGSLPLPRNPTTSGENGWSHDLRKDLLSEEVKPNGFQDGG